MADPLQATLCPRISFSISGQDLTKINVLVRVSSITWWRTVHESATKAEEVTYGYELCKRTSCMTSDRETRPWPRATRSRHCKCGIFSPCSFILLVMVGHDRKTLRKTAITRINYLTRLTTSSFLFENPRIISLFFLTRQLFHSYLIHIIQIYLNNSSSKQEDVKIQLSVKIIYYLYFLFHCSIQYLIL